jgi:hypothetical protein
MNEACPKAAAQSGGGSAVTTVGKSRTGKTVAQQPRRASRHVRQRRALGAARPLEQRGVLSTGHIVRLLIGQSHGFIRLADRREIYFHRSDMEEGTAFNDFTIGDAVTFELLEDVVSGARALRVKQRRWPE